MNWDKYTIHTTQAAEEAVCALLQELGVTGLEIDNNALPSAEELEAMFADMSPELRPELPEDDGTSRISFYLRMQAGEEETAEQEGEAVDDSYTIHDKVWSAEERSFLLGHLREGLREIARHTDIGEGRIEKSISEEADWRDEWKKYYKPLRVADWLILPAWEEAGAAEQEEIAAGRLKVVKLEPGTAFGTGTHASTRICLDALEQYGCEEDTLLDVGTGSGILGLCALKKGARHVDATELDPACEGILRENLALNAVAEDDFRLLIGNILERTDAKGAPAPGALLPEGRYDIVVANILAQVIIALLKEGEIDRFLKPGGLFISSGIIAARAAEVEAAMKANPNFEYIETIRREEWSGVVGRRR